MSTGVLQGDVLAPFLFIIVIDYVMRKSEKLGDKTFGFITHPRTCSREPDIVLNDLDYADDIAQLERNQQRAQEQLNYTNDNSKTVGLEINDKKTEQMIVFPENDQQDILPLRLNDKDIKIVTNFKYLGSLMESSEIDIQSRKAQAWAAFWKMKNIWTSKSININTKRQIFQSSVITILLYGCETWLIEPNTLKSLDVFVNNCYRVMLGYRRIDHITIDQIYREVGQRQKLSKTIRQRQLRWLGHMLRIGSSPRDSKPTGPIEPIRRYALYEPSPGLSISNKKAINTKEILYTKYIANMLIPDKKLAKEIKYTATEIESAAQNRIQWKMRVNACKAAGD